ncbi:transposase [Streptococcus equinus]|nr:transposase [Streptococcus equinus]
MKLTYEDKLEIYQLRKQGMSLPQLGQTYDVNPRNLRYMVKLMDRYGVEIVKKSKNRYYSPELKQEIINQVLFEAHSQISVSLEYALPIGTKEPRFFGQPQKSTTLNETHEFGWTYSS